MKTFNLDNEPKIKSGFTTPEHYFDDFSQRLMLQLPQNEVKVISIFAKTKIWIYASAAVLVLGFGITIVNRYSSKNNELDDATLENYIAYHASISDNELANLMDEKDIQKMKIDLKVEDNAIEKELSENNNLEQYITD